jgi:ABC-type branched-subunit amino acid transport system substrate-binding protein
VQGDTDPIKVGILHSLSGTMAISETSLKDVALMTIEEINNNGGVMDARLSRSLLIRHPIGRSSLKKRASF